MLLNGPAMKPEGPATAMVAPLTLVSCGALKLEFAATLMLVLLPLTQFGAEKDEPDARVTEEASASFVSALSVTLPPVGTLNCVNRAVASAGSDRGAEPAEKIVWAKPRLPEVSLIVASAFNL